MLDVMDDAQHTQTDEPEVVEAEIVEDSSAPLSEKVSSSVNSSPSDSDQSTILLSLDEMIKTYISSLERMQDDQKKLREMLADGLNNDAQFKEVSDRAKEAAKAKSAARAQIMNRPGILEHANKLKSLTSEIKEKQASLSDYLLEYQRLSGANQFELPNGEILEIVQIAKIVRKFIK